MEIMHVDCPPGTVRGPDDGCIPVGDLGLGNTMALERLDFLSTIGLLDTSVEDLGVSYTTSPEKAVQRTAEAVGGYAVDAEPMQDQEPVSN